MVVRAGEFVPPHLPFTRMQQTGFATPETPGPLYSQSLSSVATLSDPSPPDGLLR
jgi:hypothetical protein